MPRVRAGAQKWQQRASAATQDYRQGVMQPRRQWAEATVAAADTYAQGVQEAISEGRFAQGVRASGNQYWQNRAAQIGSSRYADGVRSGVQNYTDGFAPYRQVIEQTELPPRGPRGSAENYDRSRQMGQALNEARRTIARGT